MAHFHGTLGTTYQRFVKDTTINDQCSGSAGCGESAFAQCLCRHILSGLDPWDSDDQESRLSIC